MGRGFDYTDDDNARRILTKIFKIKETSLNSRVAGTVLLMVDGKECAKGTGKNAGKYIVPEGRTPVVVVKYNGVTLKGMKYVTGAAINGRDYTYNIKDSKKNGKVVGGTITINGVNNYTGKKTVKYALE